LELIWIVANLILEYRARYISLANLPNNTYTLEAESNLSNLAPESEVELAIIPYFFTWGGFHNLNHANAQYTLRRIIALKDFR